MLMDKLREGAQGSIAKIVFWLIILSFALAGVGSYLNRPVNTDPAEVNGETITSQALERAYTNERARMEASLGIVLPNWPVILLMCSSYAKVYWISSLISC